MSPLPQGVGCRVVEGSATLSLTREAHFPIPGVAALRACVPTEPRQSPLIRARVGKSAQTLHQPYTLHPRDFESLRHG